MLDKACNYAFIVKTSLCIGFHTLNLMDSTYPSTIWDKSSASYAHALEKYSVSGGHALKSPHPEQGGAQHCEGKGLWHT